MKYLHLILIALLFISCGNSDQIAGTSSEVDVVISIIKGSVVDNNGDPVNETTVTLYRENGSDSLGSILNIQKTSSDGTFSFDSLNGGIFNLIMNYRDSLFAVRKEILHDSGLTILNADTIRAPGVITGIVTIEKEDNTGILIFIPGTDKITTSNADGTYILPDVPASSNLSVAFQIYGYAMTILHGISVTSNDTTKLDSVNLVRNLYPTGVNTVWDSLSGTVKVTWNRLQNDDVLGYFIYSKDAREIAHFPEVLNPTKLCTSTVFIDTIDERIFSKEDSISIQYHIKAKNNREELSPFSDKSVVTVFTRRDSTMIKILELLSPSYNDTLKGGKLCPVQWNYTGLIKYVKIQYSVNNGLSWFTAASLLENHGYYEVILPNVNSDSCKIRISSVNDSLLFTETNVLPIRKTETGNLIENGDFSQGLANWKLDLYETDYASVRVIDGVCEFQINTVVTVPWHVSLIQNPIPLLSGMRYRFSFDGMSTVRNHFVGFLLMEQNDPWTSYALPEFYLDTTMQHFSIDLIMSYPDDLKASMVINPASAIGTVFIDNLKLELLPE